MHGRYNWSSTGVMTGTNVMTTEFALPAGLPLADYSLVAVANGNSSDPVPFFIFDLATGDHQASANSIHDGGNQRDFQRGRRRHTPGLFLAAQ